MRRELRVQHYSPKTEQAYTAWARRLIHFHKQHPRELSAQHVQHFFEHLTANGASPSSHQQALCAIVFLYERVLGIEMPWLANLQRPKRMRPLPVVLSREEVRRVLANMRGVPKLMAELLYGSGLRLLECARLRVKDVDFSGGYIVVRQGKG